MLYDIVTNGLINLTNDNNIEANLAWSFDGQELAFTAIQNCSDDFLKNCTIDKQYWDVWTVNIQTLEKTKWTDFSEKKIPDGDWVSNSLCGIEWSPDSQAIVFQHFCPSSGIYTERELFIALKNEKMQKQLTHFAHIDYDNYYSYKWTSDGELLRVFYNHNFIFDDTKDEIGFWVFDKNLNQISSNLTELESLIIPKIVWSDDSFIMGVDKNNSFVVTMNNNQLITHIKNLPVYEQGIWVDNKFFILAENKLYEVDITSQLITQIGQTFEGNVKFINTD